MSEIKKVNELIREVALPKAELGGGYMRAIMHDSRSMANHLNPAREALRTKVLPLIKEVVALDEDLYRQHARATEKSSEATDIVHTVLGGTTTQEAYDGFIEPVRKALDASKPVLHSSTEYVARVEASLIGLLGSLDATFLALHQQATHLDRHTPIDAVRRGLEDMQI